MSSHPKSYSSESREEEKSPLLFGGGAQLLKQAVDNDYKKLVRELKAYYSADIKEILKIEKDLADTVRLLSSRLLNSYTSQGTIEFWEWEYVFVFPNPDYQEESKLISIEQAQSLFREFFKVRALPAERSAARGQRYREGD